MSNATTSTATTPTKPNPRPKILHIQDPDAPHIHCAADFPAEPVQWLWPNRIPLGSITLLAGDPGTGKSLFAIDLAARLSTGAPWPDEAGSTEQGARSTSDSDSTLHAPCSTLILSASDQLNDTIRPRLDAAGADPARVFVLGNITNLRTDMEKLRQAIDETRDLRLLVIDPINFFVGPGDAHFQTVVRTVLEPLAALARKKKFAILAITHFRKNDGAAIRRAAGSMGFVATARAIWTLAPDPHDPTRRELIPLKNNLTEPTPGLAFHIMGKMTNDETQMTNDPTFEIRHSEIRHSYSAPHLNWDPTPVAVASSLAAHKPRPSTPREEAQKFLRTALADGPRSASELLDLADARGLTRRTVQRAFHDLAGCTTKRGFQAGWWWSFGEYPIAPIPDYPAPDALAEPAYATDVADKISALRINDKLLQSLASKIPAASPGPSRKCVSPSPAVSPSPIAARNGRITKSSAAEEPTDPQSAVAFASADPFAGSFTRAWLQADDHEPTLPIPNPSLHQLIANSRKPKAIPFPNQALHLTPAPAY